MVNNLSQYIPLRISNLATSFIALVVFLKGFGFCEIYDFSIFILAVILLLKNLRCPKVAILSIVLLLLQVIAPGTSRLWGFCTLLFISAIETRGYALLSMTFWLLEAFGFVVDSPRTILICWGVCTLLPLLNKPKVISCICICGVIWCVVSTIVSIACLHRPQTVESYDNSIYAASNVFCRIAGVSYANDEDANNALIRETPFYTQTSENAPGIHIYDIDSPNDSTYTENGVWQQPISWHDNQLYGNQYYLEGIKTDGGLYSNKGVVLKKSMGRTQLSYPSSFTHSHPLIVKCGNTLYVHDSDYFSSFLANYQKNLLKELCGTSPRPIFIRLLNLLLGLLCLLYFINSSTLYKITLPIFILLLACAVYFADFRPADGEIRMVGNITNSHENDKFDGTPKKIVAAGFDYVTGNKNAKVLIVQKKHSATVDKERLVVAEDDCTIHANGKILKVVNNPLGNINGVIDARQWLFDGKLFNGRIDIDGIVFIATGSPALQSWNDLLK
jgi:hypothetical protein